MAIGTAPVSVEDADLVVERRLTEAARELKWFEFLVTGGKLVAGLLLALLAVVAVDHWVWPLPAWARAITLVGLVAGAGWYFWTRILPLLIWKLNPVYVARRIEQATPELKNSLVNCLTYRADRSSLARFVMRALQQKAAADLAHVPEDAAIDRGSVLRTLTVLGTVAVVFLIYSVLSPKSTLLSLRRLAQPWGALATPTRVRITKVEPGDTTVMFGERVSVQAEVDGVSDDESVFVFYSTDDRKTIERRVRMQRTPAGPWTAQLPAETEGGMRSDATYYVVAGDARSPTFRITIEPEPTMLIERIEYEYPPYTGLPNRTATGRGAIRAIDGTRVTIHARANQDIGSATLLHFREGTQQPRELLMQHEGRLAHYSLWLNVEDGQRQSYRLELISRSGHRPRRLVSHDIQVIPDLPPEVEIRLPRQSPVEVPLNGSQVISVRAIDPDFSLKKVSLLMEGLPGDLQAREIPLLEPNDPPTARYAGQYVFRPEEWNLKVGDRITYRAMAVDNRVLIRRGLQGNQTLTDERVFIITKPVDLPDQNPAAAPNEPGKPAPDRPESPSSDSADAERKENQQPKDSKRDESKQSPKDKGMDREEDSAKDQESHPQDKVPTKQDPQEPAPDKRETDSSMKDEERPSDSQSPTDQEGQTEGSETGETSDGSSPEEGARQSDSKSAGTQERESKSSEEMSVKASDSGERSGDKGQEAGASEDENSTPKEGGAQNTAGSDSQPSDTTPATHDGDVFERTLELLQERQRQ
ncbi:MAG TPA: hypothetical protein ENJ50_06175, partial [Planctomycetaceae bacterium]|nr:hypothetical protein [Planctomycetaceae bacterium]